MTAAKPKYVPDPRTWNEFQVATRLNRTVKSFRDTREQLERMGFPKKDALLGGWDSKAIERWMDARAGIDLAANSDEAAALVAVHRLHARAS